MELLNHFLVMLVGYICKLSLRQNKKVSLPVMRAIE